MSSVLSPKLRWSKSKLPTTSDQKSPQPEKSKLSLNLFFGLKSKKPSSPVHQDPPASLASPANILPDSNTDAVMYTKRAPSKSISSTRSHVDSIGPKTPIDAVSGSRQSLLTLSDLDPFAGRGITVVSSPHSALGSNRLSVYSNSSLPDVGKTENSLYFNSPAPSSPTSRPLSPDPIHFSSLSPSRPVSKYSRRTVLKKYSVDLSRDRPNLASDSLSGPSTEEALSKSGSTLTITDKDDWTLALPPRPTRARGMTESAMSFSNYKMQLSANPSRQSSISRFCPPLSAPPDHGLPPPPVSNILSHGNVLDDEDNIMPPKSSASSSLSFASISSDAFLTYSPRKKDKLPDNPMNESQKSPKTPPVPARRPKKSVSHSSLLKLSSRSSGELSESHMGEGMGRDQEERQRHKTRSFHHPRLPTLPYLSRSVNTLPMPSSPTESPSPNIEQRRGSNSSPSRRRLFSGPSQRPSTSQSLGEDDAQSVFSLRSEQNLSSSPSRPRVKSPRSPSFGDEPSSPQFANKYTPQHIMTPAEMAKVEASVEAISSPRSRGFSISTITPWKEKDNGPATPPPPSPFTNSSTFPSRNSSLLLKGTNPPVRPPPRPATSQANLCPPTNEQPFYRPSSSPPLPLMSLPPPPRPRVRTTTEPCLTKATSAPPCEGGFDPRSSLQPPPRKNLLSKASLGNLLLHHSLSRKPSFLEIDDGGAQDTSRKSDQSSSPGDSFLDLTRESFDINAN